MRFDSWDSLMIPRFDTLKLLDWPNLFPWVWPLDHSILSTFREKITLLWISTQFNDAFKMKNWLTEKGVKNISKEHTLFLQWLLPSLVTEDNMDTLVDRSSKFHLLAFMIEYLERAHLWYGREPSWPSSLNTALNFSRQCVEKFREKGFISEKLVFHIDVEDFMTDNGWGDFGWLRHRGECGFMINTVNRLLLMCCHLNDSLPTQDKLKELVFECCHTLFRSAELFLSTSIPEEHIPSDKRDWRSTSVIDQILTREKKWCRDHLAIIIDEE